MIVLGIETSCDETGLAVYDGASGRLLADALHSQVDMHAVYGGVVPELASRDHVRRVLPLMDQVLGDAGLTRGDLDAIAYTAGPGLVGALLAGGAVAKGLAWALEIPAIGVHHMEGHLLAPLLEGDPPAFPFLALLVSGGHTQLMRADAIGAYHLLGESVDDAAGEAFDKAAKMLGLAYPGGPEIARIAVDGTPGRFRFPRPMTDRPGLDFSFSGLKTYTLNTVNRLAADGPLSDQDKADVAHAFQEAVVDTMVIKCRRAVRETGLDTLVMAGGVSANRLLRQRLEAALAKERASVRYAAPRLCTDNGAMIAFAGAQRLAAGQREDLAIQARPRWPMTELAPVAGTAPGAAPADAG